MLHVILINCFKLKLSKWPKQFVFTLFFLEHKAIFFLAIKVSIKKKVGNPVF